MNPPAPGCQAVRECGGDNVESSQVYIQAVCKACCPYLVLVIQPNAPEDPVRGFPRDAGFIQALPLKGVIPASYLLWYGLPIRYDLVNRPPAR